MMAAMKLKFTLPFLAVLLSVSPGQASEQILQFMEDRWTHALMRQVGDEANGEPLALGRANCVDKRALNRRQRNVARRLGQAFERSGIHIDLIATSAWCRAIETARTLKLRPVTVDPILDASTPDDTDASERVLDLLDGMRRTETALLVTHAGNIKALTDRDTRPGEVIVVRLRPGEDIEVIGAYILD
ncbi:MAG: hypothetical protein AAGD13_00990 [Pseudomonadota bacterium]